MDRIRVLIVDDHALFREGIRLILQTQEDIDIVGEAADGGEAIDAARTLEPDVVLMDVTMPGVDGLAAFALSQGPSAHRTTFGAP